MGSPCPSQIPVPAAQIPVTLSRDGISTSLQLHSQSRSGLIPPQEHPDSLVSPFLALRNSLGSLGSCLSSQISIPASQIPAAFLFQMGSGLHPSARAGSGSGSAPPLECPDSLDSPFPALRNSLGSLGPRCSSQIPVPASQIPMGLLSQMGSGLHPRTGVQDWDRDWDQD